MLRSPLGVGLPLVHWCHQQQPRRQSSLRFYPGRGGELPLWVVHSRSVASAPKHSAPAVQPFSLHESCARLARWSQCARHSSYSSPRVRAYWSDVSLGLYTTTPATCPTEQPAQLRVALQLGCKRIPRQRLGAASLPNASCLQDLSTSRGEQVCVHKRSLVAQNNGRRHMTWMPAMQLPSWSCESSRPGQAAHPVGSYEYSFLSQRLSTRASTQ
jgi:hypothetical protein